VDGGVSGVLLGAEFEVWTCPVLVPGPVLV
jgi:hypothetical protein